VQVEYKLLRPTAYKYLEFESVGEYQAADHSISGKVKNIGDETASLAKVVGILYDSSGRMLGWTYAFVEQDKLAPDASSPFTLRFADLLEGEAASYDLYVEASTAEKE
jgi:hypothetical protein